MIQCGRREQGMVILGTVDGNPIGELFQCGNGPLESGEIKVGSVQNQLVNKGVLQSARNSLESGNDHLMAHGMNQDLNRDFELRKGLKKFCDGLYAVPRVSAIKFVSSIDQILF